MYDFNMGLSQVERLEVLIESPLLQMLRLELPTYGMSTKPSMSEPAALLVVGAATLICGSDRAADRELSAHWQRLERVFLAAGYRVPAKPLRSQHFRDYRDVILGGELPEQLKAATRALFAGLAVEIGLFPISRSAWSEPHLDGIVSSDGTWFQAASEVSGLETSRSRTGCPRVLNDTDRKNNRGRGYMFCITSIRGSEPRKRVVLDIAHAPKSAEMDVVVPSVLRLHDELGDRFRCFVYDGAMQGKDHRRLREAGLVTVNKPKGVRRLDQWERFRDSEVGGEAKVLELDMGCGHRHLVTATAGVLWDLEPTADGRYRRRRILEVSALRRLGPVDGRYSWELALVIRCPHGDHVHTLDPNAKVPCATGEALRQAGDGPLKYRSTLNLSDKLRVIQVNDENFAAIYGRRNDSESGNNSAKFDFGLGHRARSYTVQRHDSDMWIYALLANALVWKEHAQSRRTSSPSVVA